MRVLQVQDRELIAGAAGAFAVGLPGACDLSLARRLKRSMAIYMGLVARDIRSMYWSSRSAAEGSQFCWAQNFSPVR